MDNAPALVIEYTDPEEGFQGWLVMDSLAHELCAGACGCSPTDQGAVGRNGPQYDL